MKKTIALLSIIFMLSSCFITDNKKLTASGPVSTSTIDIANFDAIAVSDNIQVEITTGDNYEVKLEASESLKDYVVFDKDGNELEIKFKNGFYINNSNVKVYITAPFYSSLSVAGSGSLTSNGLIDKLNKLNIEVSGSGNISMQLDAPTVNAAITGSGSVNLSGRTKTLDVQVSGSGQYKGADLKSEDCKVAVTGSGDAQVFASTTLDARITGSGTVTYGGKPAITKSITGSGSLNSL
jgi:hypothetical protein